MKLALLALVARCLWTASSAFQMQPLFPASGTIVVPASSSSSTTRLGVVNVHESAPRDVAAFDEWASACGVQRSPGFQLTSQDGMEYSAVTAEGIPAQSPVLFVPSMMILTSNQAKAEFGRCEAAEQRLVSAKAADHISHFYLFLKILREYEMGEQSQWFPWLNSLPRYYSNGASMTPFCFECLPPLVGQLAANERVRYIQFFQALNFVDFISESTKSSKELTKWAFAVVHTRCFETEDGDVKLVPMADMFDHGTEVEVDISYDEEGNCYAYSHYDIPGGNPLRMSYGDYTNPSRLFARWGFLDKSSPATFCKIMIKRPDDKLVKMGYDHSKMLFYKDTGDVSEEVWDVLLYMNLANDPGQQQAFYDAHTNGDYDIKQQYHSHYFSETLASLQNHVDTFLSSLDELEAKTEGRSVEEHPRLPLITGHNEFVRETFLRVKANIDSM